MLVLALPVGAQKNRNSVVSFGDDIEYWRVGVYTHSMKGWTQNIDSIAKNGMLFTDTRLVNGGGGGDVSDSHSNRRREHFGDGVM